MLVRELVALALGRRRLHRVRGHSMAPGLREGDLVVLDPRAFHHRAPRPGEVVVVRHPYRGVHLVKRVATVGNDGRIRVVGDAADESTDSRTFGAIAPDRVLGRVTHRIPGARR